MYSGVLFVHSWLRWIVILLGLLAFVRARASAGRGWQPAFDRPGLFFTIALDIQFLLGLSLYLFLSPNTTAAFKDVGAAMGQAPIRFWLVEHPFGMIVAIILAHVGRARSRSLPESRRMRSAALFYGMALVILLLTQPWPGLPYGRALFRHW